MKYVYYYQTKIGNIRIIESELGIYEIDFYKEKDDSLIEEETKLIKQAANQLNEYFEGKRKTFDFKLDKQGTDFQMKVWAALETIPYGTTWSYKDLACAIGNEKASRAVGNANNKNRLMIVVPCHRVIGTNGKLVGYAGGLDKKEILLELERKYK